MKSPEISISFRSESREDILQATAAAAGRYGFDVISVYEDLGDQSPMYPLLTMAGYSKNARLGPACIAVPKYSTMEPIAGEIARLDSASNGRAYLGLSAGAWMEQVGLKSATVSQVREAADVTRYLLEKRDDGFFGEYYNIQPGFVVSYKTPEQRVPLLIGAWGEKMAALGGEIADEVKIGGSANPQMVPIMRERIEKGAKRVGRNPDDIAIVLGAVTVVDEDRAKALYIARKRAVVYIDVVGHKDPTVLLDFPQEITAIQRAMKAGDIDDALRYLPDELITRFLFAGTPHDIIRQTEQAFEKGASRVEYGAPHGIDQVQGIDLLGSKVLPYFK